MRAERGASPLVRRLLFLIVSIFSLEVSTCVEIHKLSVPSLVKYGTMGEVFLDCDFDHSEEEEKQLEVKWYHNDEHSPFFQWLPGSNRPPQVIGDFFRDHLDPSASASASASGQRDAEVDGQLGEGRGRPERSAAAVTKRNHTLRLFNIVPELSGSYKCKVSSFIDEDFKQMDMLVYSYPEEVEFEQRVAPAPSVEEVEVECAVRGIYPQPKIAVTWSDRDGTSYSRFEPMSTSPNANDSSLFDCALQFKLNHSSLPSETSFMCEVQLPETEMRTVKTAVYYPGARADDAPAAESSSSQSDSTAASSSISIKSSHSHCASFPTFLLVLLAAPIM